MVFKGRAVGMTHGVLDSAADAMREQGLAVLGCEPVPDVVSIVSVKQLAEYSGIPLWQAQAWWDKWAANKPVVVSMKPGESEPPTVFEETAVNPSQGMGFWFGKESNDQQLERLRRLLVVEAKGER